MAVAMDPERLLKRLRRGHVANVAFHDAERLLTSLGFSARRTSGSHRIYRHPDVPELVNVQNVDGKAKAYQLRQVLRLVERYNLTLEDDR